MPITVEDVKRELNITWQDEQDEQDIAQKLQRAQQLLISAHGKKELDFDKNAEARQLLFDLIKYLRADAYAEFLKDYAAELNALYIDALEVGTDDKGQAVTL